MDFMSVYKLLIHGGFSGLFSCWPRIYEREHLGSNSVYVCVACVCACQLNVRNS